MRQHLEQDSKYHTHRLSRFEVYSEHKLFCNEPTPLYSTQNTDIFKTYKEVFCMHSGQRNPLHLPQNGDFNHFSTQLVN